MSNKLNQFYLLLYIHNVLVRAIYHVMILDILKSIKKLVMVVNTILSAITV